MNFSNIPFNGALERLGELLPIGTFIRMRSVVPSYWNVPLIQLQFQSITVERSPTAFLSITFEELGEDGVTFTTEVESPEAVFNNGPLGCYCLKLHCLEGVPAEAVNCYELLLPPATPATIPFLKCGARHVYFVLKDEEAPPQTLLPLKTVLANLEPKVRVLRMPWSNLAAVTDPTHCQPSPNQREFPYTRVEIPFSTFAKLIEWLRTNAAAVARNHLCGKAVLICRSHEITDDNEVEELRRSALPYCPHPPNGHKLHVLVARNSYHFYYDPEMPCLYCLAAQQNNDVP